MLPICGHMLEKTQIHACESFHRYFGEHFTSPRPNIYTFLEGLREEQERTVMKQRSTQKTSAKRKCIREKYNKRKELREKYEAKEMTQQEFLTEMCMLMLPALV